MVWLGVMSCQTTRAKEKSAKYSRMQRVVVSVAKSGAGGLGQ